jgi:hypothetical protein
VTNIYAEQEFVLKMVESMEWSHNCPFSRVCHQACLTQHIGQALDHYVGRVSKLALTNLLGALPNIMGKGLIILLVGVQALP